MRALNGPTAMLLAGTLVMLTPAATFASQQAEAVVTQGDLDQALAAQSLQEQEARAAILSLLQRAEVVEMAEEMSLDLTRAEDAVATLEGPEIERLADRAADVERALKGGQKQTITLSVTTLLLVIIILLLIA